MHGGQLGPEDLDGHPPVVPEILGEVHGGHPAGADLPLEAVPLGHAYCSRLSSSGMGLGLWGWQEDGGGKEVPPALSLVAELLAEVRPPAMPPSPRIRHSLPRARPRPSSPHAQPRPAAAGLADPANRSGTRALLERGLDSSSGLGFVRERLALLSKTLFLVSFAFYLFLLASMVLIGGAPFVAVVRGPVALGHLFASLTMALLWLVASRTRPTLRSLGALDVVSFVVAGGFLSLMTIEEEGRSCRRCWP